MSSNLIMVTVKRIIKYVKNKWQRFYSQKILTSIYNKKLNKENNRFSCEGLLINTHIRVHGKDNKICIEKGAIIKNTTISITGYNNEIVIHNNVRFIENGRIRIEDTNNRLEIGENATIIGCFFSIADNNTEIKLGKSCLISANVIIRTSDSHSICNMSGERINNGRSVIIKDHVWVGYGATILKGSQIGADSVVGTNSLVAGINTPSNCVIAGIPAKVVKNDITWTTKRL